MVEYAADRHERQKALGARGKSAASEVFGCIPHDAPEKLCFGGKLHEVRPKGPQGAARGAYAAAGNENYCGNLLWQSSVTLLPPEHWHTREHNISKANENKGD